MWQADVIFYALNPSQNILLCAAREVIRREGVDVLADALETGIHFLLKRGEASIHLCEAFVYRCKALVVAVEALFNLIKTLSDFIKSSRNHGGEFFNVFIFKRRCHGGKCTLPPVPVK